MKCEHEFVTKFGTIECQKCGAEFDEIETNTKFGTFTSYEIKQKQNTMTIEQAKERLLRFKSDLKFGTVTINNILDIFEEVIDVLANDKTNPTSENIGFDWECLPKWADRWIAMDENGLWNSFCSRPRYSNRNIFGKLESKTTIPKAFYPTNFTGSWKDSLFLNPKYK